MTTRIARTSRRLAASAAALALSVSLASCTGDDGDSKEKSEEGTDVTEGLEGRPLELAEEGAIRIGVKYDQPGVGYREPGAPSPEGFDIEIGRILAKRLGIPEDRIAWVEAVSESREALLNGGSFDVVIASYSITDERRAEVGQAGPYFTTGQQLLVRAEETAITGPDTLANKPVCSVKGSTSLERVETEYGAKPVGFQTYSECVDRLIDKEVDAVTTDGPILLGYAAQQPAKLKVVGETFSEERYGIGYNLEDEGMCDFLNQTLQESFDDGAWEEAFAETLGATGVEPPEPPDLDDCQ